MNWAKIGLFAGGALFGSAGIEILTSKDAKKLYTQCTAAVLRMKDQVMKTATTLQENCGDILADAREINEQRAAEDDAVLEDTAEEKADKGGVKLKGAELAQWLCYGKLMALAGGDKVTFEPAKLKRSAEGIKGEVSLRQEKGWQDLCLTCEVQGNRVTRLIWQPLPGANKPQ